jgi:hypothetical protein
MKKSLQVNKGILNICSPKISQASHGVSHDNFQSIIRIVSLFVDKWCIGHYGHYELVILQHKKEAKIYLTIL